MTVSVASPSDVSAMRELWRTAFGDSEQEINAFFERFDPTSYALVAKEGDVLCSMLFLLPADWHDGNKTQSIGYIYAGATHPSMRGKGYYKQLLEFARNYAIDCGMTALFLRPATKALESSYRRMGFTAPLTCDVYPSTVAPIEGMPLDAATYRRLRAKFLQERGISFADGNERFWEQVFVWCHAVETGNGIALYSDEEQHVQVWEWLSDEPIAALPNGVPATVRTVGETTVIGLLMPLSGTFPASGYFGYGLE